jgi:hypothetical protein
MNPVPFAGAAPSVGPVTWMTMSCADCACACAESDRNKPAHNISAQITTAQCFRNRLQIRNIPASGIAMRISDSRNLLLTISDFWRGTGKNCLDDGAKFSVRAQLCYTAYFTSSDNFRQEWIWLKSAKSAAKGRNTATSSATRITLAGADGILISGACTRW